MSINSSNNLGGRRKPELLAPAGEMNAALAAFEAGADAVYAGLRRFSARERAANFSTDELGALVSLARRSGRKVYAALNTLVKESELPDAAAVCAELSDIGPDAVIVQDIGLALMIREFFPRLALHASTQMAVHNSAGVAAAGKIGFSRVILERQMTLDEVAAVRRASPLELEVFVHGALCCSLSGCCLLSSWLGGFSGNRGRCKQPCRRKYFSDGGKGGYWLSPSDLCMLDSVPALKRMGVDSLKIEGRLRKADYVDAVVRAYRPVIDAGSPDEEAAALEEGWKILKSSPGRKFFHGFARMASFDEVIQPDRPGVSGQYCGRVLRSSGSGFEIVPERKIHLGDRLRALSNDTVDENSFTVTSIVVGGKSATKAGRGERCFIAAPEPPPACAEVYKIGQSHKDFTSRAANVARPGFPLDIEISLGAAGFSATLPGHPDRPVWRREFQPEPAVSRPLSEEDLRAEFATRNDSPFEAARIGVSLGGAFFVRSSDLRAMRRDFWAWVAEGVKPADFPESGERSLQRFMEFYNSGRGGDGFPVENTVMGRRVEGCVFALPALKWKPGADEASLPFFCPEGRLAELARRVEELYKGGVRRFRATSLYALELLSGLKGVKIATSFPLPACNSLAAAELARLGAEKVQAWVELEEPEVLGMARGAPEGVEVFLEGIVPVLSTRMKIPAPRGVIRDSLGNEFETNSDDFTGINFVSPVIVMRIPDPPGLSGYCEDAKRDGRGFSEFNHRRGLK